MIQYIYFVKCPNCEDEHFDFFDDAKAFALGCLSSKPIITQTEVCRNDFGECTDSVDLGTVWSWEDMVKETETEPAASVLTKDILSANGEDPEFNNDVFKVFNDLIKDEYEAIDGYEAAEDLLNQYDFSSEDKDLILSTLAHIKAEEEEHIDELEKLPYKNTKSDAGSNFCCKETKVPIPDGMTIKELVEELEANEDTVECVCCNELYPKEECHHDEKHGWICPDCKDKVVECTWCNELYDRSECRYEVDLGWLCGRCEAAIKSRGETLTFRENNYWDFLDEDASLKEAFNPQEPIELYYDSLTTTVCGNQRDVDDWDEAEYTSDYSYMLTKDDVANTIWDVFITEEDVADVPGGLEALEDDEAWKKFLETHFDDLFEKYYDELLEYYKDAAQEAFGSSTSWDDYKSAEADKRADYEYELWRDAQFDESC